MVFSQCSVHCFSLLPSSCPFDLPGPQYRLEKQSEPNIAVDLESTLESQSAWEFCLVRENSSRADGVFEEDSQIDIATVQDMLSSHHYKSFKVSMIHRLRFTTDVQLGISGDKVEIDPVTSQKASTKFWIKQKPISIDSDLLCACDLAEEKSPSHAICKLSYLSNHDYKHLYFESDAATVNEIVLKVSVPSRPRPGVCGAVCPLSHSHPAAPMRLLGQFCRDAALATGRPAGAHPGLGHVIRQLLFTEGLPPLQCVTLASHSTSLGLCFSSCKMGIMVATLLHPTKGLLERILNENIK